MNELPRLKMDSPYTQQSDGSWELMIPAGRDVEWGHAFDPVRGYRVFLGFKDSFGKNTIGPESARRAADQIGDATPDCAQLSAQIRRCADQVDGLNRGWEAAGRPATGLDGLEVGRA